jgi:hypothetical protein
MISAIAIAMLPGPAKTSAAVNSVQPAVAMSSRRFFAAWASAQAPSMGAVSRTAR